MGNRKRPAQCWHVLIFNDKVVLTMQCHSSSWHIPQANFKFWVWKKKTIWCSFYIVFTWSSESYHHYSAITMSHIYFELTKDHTERELECLNGHFSTGLKPPSHCKNSPCCRKARRANNSLVQVGKSHLAGLVQQLF